MDLHSLGSRFLQNTGALGGVVLLLVLSAGTLVFAYGERVKSEKGVINQARAAWMNGSANQALDILDQEISHFPKNSNFQKLRGNILTTIRRNQEALEVYGVILEREPDSLEVRWAKWSVLTRIGEGDLAIFELRGIAQRSPHNPLVHLRLAQELRKLDRLEESIDPYRQAVFLAPELPGWRLSLGRALFDVLDYEGARKEVEGVLQSVPKGSPVEAAARNLLMVVYGATKERGRRFQPIFTPEGTGAELKQWALIRNKAWTLFTAGRYEEAEQVFREVLILKPSDHRAAYELGQTLMELNRYQEAIDFLQKGIDQGASNEVYLDSIFRIGQCLVELEQWPEALMHFELLQEIGSAPRVNSEENQESTDDAPMIAGAPVLDMQKVAQWVEKIRTHLPHTQKATGAINPASPDPVIPDPPPVQTEELPTRSLEGLEPVHSRASLMGRDADFSWFRFAIPARTVMRDDLLMGSHEFIPIDPGDTFPVTQQEIFVVFSLVTPSYDEIPLTAKCFLETSEISSSQAALVQDRVIMSMNDQSGYFRFQIPQEGGWKPGLYRCGLFVGDVASAYNVADDVRFRIVASD
ncbi:MAG: tetratricopeptide repeat protein [Nitrospira sp.]|nr:tetratricopeptide repeat protein [Nitrospira sp.]